MQEIEVISWDVLDAIREKSSEIIEEIGDLDTDDGMSVFCQIGEDFFELHYSEIGTNYLKHFPEEDEMTEYVEKRKADAKNQEFDPKYFHDEDGTDECETDDFKGYSVGDLEEDGF
jgi:hypothetical protein